MRPGLDVCQRLGSTPFLTTILNRFFTPALGLNLDTISNRGSVRILEFGELKGDLLKLITARVFFAHGNTKVRKRRLREHLPPFVFLAAYSRYVP